MQKNLDANLRFGFLVHDVSRLRRIVVDRALKPLGITRSQWWVLAFLSRRDGMTQTALAADLDLTKVAIGGLVDRMEETLRHSRWLAGDSYSLADIGAVPFIKRLDEEIAPEEITPAKHPRVAAWWTAIQSRPAFATAKIGPFTG